MFFGFLLLHLQPQYISCLVENMQYLSSEILSNVLWNNINITLKGMSMTVLTHCGRVTQICVFTLQLCRTGDADLRF